MGLFLAPKREALAFGRIPATRLLKDRTTVFQNLCLPANLVLNGGTNIGNRVQVLHLRTGAQSVCTLRTQGDVGVAAHLPLLHVTVRDTGVNNELAQRIEEGYCLGRTVEIRLRHNLSQRYTGAVKINDSFKRLMGQLTGIFLQVNSIERHPAVLALDIPRRTGQLDLHLSTYTERLLVLCQLVILRRVRVKVIFAIPLTDFRDLTLQHEAQLGALLNRRMIENRQRTR